MTTHITANTDKIYRCVSCGSKSANIVREGATLGDTKVKCNECSFLYTAQDSKELEEKGQIPDGPPVVQTKETQTPHGNDRRPKLDRRDDGGRDAGASKGAAGLPRTPAYILISKDRSRSQICSRKDFKDTLLAWQYMREKFDVYELITKKVSTKIDIQ